jgi:transglutaminase-like putative cysteine protease
MVAAGWLVPKSSPFWPDPVPWIKSQSLEVIGKTGWGDLPQKVGYDTNDERLGGSFVQDDRIVFTATVNIPTYWRGESKDVYTGTGWKDGEDDKMPITLPFNRDTVPVAGQTVVQQVSYQMPFDFILMGGQLRQLQGIYPDQDALVYLPEKEKIQTDQHTPVKAYSAVTVMPIINEKLLKQSGDDYPQQIRSRYLQLPSDLPARIKEKTLQLTEDETDSYSKVEAVERYLGSSAFHYQTEEIPVPDARRDFVDQFLFETREGYCDYFSTSMAVMLRTIGIPTRWVKGFNMGEVTSFADGGRQEVVVRNRNAHSWVEVYFAGVGWIPFDPTPVFVPPFEVIPDTQSGETAAEGQQQEEKVAQENQLTQKQSVDLSGLKGTLSGIAKWFGWKWANWLILLVILLLLAATWAGAAVVFLPWWSLERRFVFQFKRLLYVTSLRLRVKRHPSQTAREWFAEAGALLGGATRQEWQDLIRQYERIQYANARLNKAEWQEWKRKMRRLALRLRLKSS